MLNHVGMANHLLSAYNFHGLLLTLWASFVSSVLVISEGIETWDTSVGKTLSYNHLSFPRCSFRCFFFCLISFCTYQKLSQGFAESYIKHYLCFFCSLCCTHKTSLTSSEYLGIASDEKPLSSQHEIWRFVNHTDPICFSHGLLHEVVCWCFF